MSYNQKGLDKIANNMLQQATLMQKLTELAGRKNYPGKVKRLSIKIKEELELWERKETSPKLLDLRKDLLFVESQIDPESLNRDKIDILAVKYSIGYGEINRSTH